MRKGINEKTFELNITNELLNVSRQITLHWYLHSSPLLDNISKDKLVRILKQEVIFASGLTQEEESKPESGGYDVAIKYQGPNNQESRLMLLQFKSGVHKKYCRKIESYFSIENARNEGRESKHIAFTFNDAANGTQHSTLRNLAHNSSIKEMSVLYVFPRITKLEDFKNKVGELIKYTSFVPVLELDKQAAAQIPPLSIIDGTSHKYRTSYDGTISEVNYYYYYYYYDHNIISNILSELVCVQIERTLRAVADNEQTFILHLIDSLSNSINSFDEFPYSLFNYLNESYSKVILYINRIKNEVEQTGRIPSAPTQFTTIIPNEGLTIQLDKNIDYSNISYQVL